TDGIELGSGSNPSIAGCTFAHNTEDGLYSAQASSDPLVSDCAFHDNGGYAASVCGGSVSGFTGTMTITGNTNNAIRLFNDGDVRGTWFDHGVPYVVAGNLQTIDGQTLTMSPGVELRFAGNYQLNMNGKIVADGEPGNHIVFTSDQPTPAPGDWNNLYFWYPDAGCLFDYCEFRYGGSGAGMLWMGYAYSNVTMSNCVVDSSATAGIMLAADSDPTISGSSFGGNVGDGLYSTEVSSHPLVSDCTFHDNGGHAASVCGASVAGFTGAMTITGNANNTIRLFSDANLQGTWYDHGVPYFVAGDLATIDAQTLTLSPGVELRFAGNYALQVNGRLVADGEPGNHILFTSNGATPAPGDWKYVYFWYPEPNTLLDHCDFRYGGSVNAMVDIQNGGSNVTLTNCTFEQSATAGARVASGTAPHLISCSFSQNQGAGVSCGGSPTFQHCQLTQNLYGLQGSAGAPVFAVGNEIINNTSYGFYLTGGCAPVFGDTLSEWNDIYGNGTYDFYNGNSDVYAYYVYWGTTDPSVISAHIWDDVDNASLGVVYFTHWLDETHENEQTLVAPVITSITEAAGTVQLTWNVVPGAVSYRVVSSVKPWASYSVDLTGSFAGTTWSAPLNGDIRFYRVNAVAGSEVSAPSNIVGYEQFVTAVP
ncbi:MAG: right-handed parallel beta-helix repeat-containing protein, partial [Candidatus Eisenbacteria bacterium]|nr:right-handed parallel beta-helix repeat-containing protein [Candidatus Eisenbacteria bacterium]